MIVSHDLGWRPRETLNELIEYALRPEPVDELGIVHFFRILHLIVILLDHRLSGDD